MDMRTIFVFATIFYFFMSILLLITQLVHGKRFPAVSTVFWGSLFLTLGMFLILFQGFTIPFISVVLANITMILGIFIIQKGVLKLFEQKTNDVFNFSIVFITFVLICVFLYVYPDVTSRILVVTASVFLLQAVPFYKLKNEYHRFKVAGIFIFYSLAFYQCLLALRVVLTALTLQNDTLMDMGGSQGWFIIAYLVAYTGWVVGVLVLVAEKLLKEESEMRKSKALLLRELHHRTKNNMQVLLAYIELQKRKMKEKPPEAIVEDIGNQIRIISLAQDRLHSSEDLSNLELGNYLKEVALMTAQSYQNLKNEIIIDFDLDTVDVLIDIAIPCGCIVNELITNAYRHAFNDRDSGHIILSLKKVKESILLHVVDNGSGVDAVSDGKSRKSLGLTIVRSIAEQQLQGKCSFEKTGGFKALIEFKNNSYLRRIQ